ncbi:MAG TPA: class I SAM-dependent methyltransferase [Salinimicrobium sp.]|nr:class I SAM-dependent methyltransferase [Salinimicrobium sp.]
MKQNTAHWNSIYKTKNLTEVSWHQQKPETSLRFISNLKLKKDAKIIDVGGGNSFLVELLLELGYTNLSVLDISEEAIKLAKEKLAAKAAQVNWIVTDISDFKPTQKYDLWHDRAAFHFLTEEKQVLSYLNLLRHSIKAGGFVILGTFSEKGPTKCSGLKIKQYSKAEMIAVLSANFEKIQCENLDHTTPSGQIQNFTFCSFKKRKESKEA